MNERPEVNSLSVYITRASVSSNSDLDSHSDSDPNSNKNSNPLSTLEQTKQSNANGPTHQSPFESERSPCLLRRYTRLGAQLIIVAALLGDREGAKFKPRADGRHEFGGSHKIDTAAASRSSVRARISGPI